MKHTEKVKPPIESEYQLVHRKYHSDSGIGELHVTVIKALAAVIGDCPCENCYNLSDWVSIEGLDSIPEYFTEAHYSRVSFTYEEFDRDLMVSVDTNECVEIHEK